MKMKLLSPVQTLVTPWIAAHEAPPSVGFYRQEYWSVMPVPSPLLSLQSPYSLNNVAIFFFFFPYSGMDVTFEHM